MSSGNPACHTRVIVWLKRADLISLLLVASIFLPMVFTGHYRPVATFYNEWGAGITAIAATVLIANRLGSGYFSIPRSIVIPLALLPAVFYHLVMGSSITLTVPLFFLIFIASATLFMILGSTLATLSPATRGWHPAWPLPDLVALGFLFAALVGTVISWHWRMDSGIIDTPGWGADGGLLGQRNHNGLIFWLGICSLNHFFLNSQLSLFTWLSGLLILVEAALFAGSRSVFLYACIGLLAAGVIYLRSSGANQRWRTIASGLTPCGLMLMIIAAQQLLTFDIGSTTAVSRINSAVIAQDGRGGLWWIAAQIIHANPWLGVGPGGYLRESMLLSDSVPAGLTIEIPASHAHNMFLQLAAELGIASATFVGVGLLYWIYSTVRYQATSMLWIYSALPLMVMTHNQLEYSLWYLHLLIPVALCIGASSKMFARRASASVILLVSLAGLLLAVQLSQDYQSLRKTLAEASTMTREELTHSAQDPIFGPWVSAVLTTNALANKGFSPNELFSHAQRGLSVPPLYKSALETYSNGLSRSGNEPLAQRIQTMTKRAFPELAK